jgi:hypothetical protein
LTDDLTGDAKRRADIQAALNGDSGAVDPKKGKPKKKKK